MIRSELAARIAARNPHLYQREIDALIKAMFNRIATALASGDRVEIRKFGIFEVRQRNARIIHHPKTGKREAIGIRGSISFRTGKTMNNRLNRTDVTEGQESEQLLRASP